MDEALTMTMQVGSREFLKAVIKIAVNYYLLKTSDKNTILQRIEDLKSDKGIGIEMVRHYYTNESVNYITPEEVSHTIYVKGDKQNKYLFAFVELFSSYAFIVSLNSDYAGNDFASSYTYDVLTCNEIEKHVQIDYNGKLDESNPDLNSQFIETLTKKINRAMAIGDRRQTDAIISEITKVAMKETIGKYPDGTIITAPMMNEFFNKVAQDAAPFIAHLHNKRNRQ